MMFILANMQTHSVCDVCAYNGHSRTQQRTDQRVLVCTYIEIFGPKKTGFSPVKILPKIFLHFFYLYSMQLFSADNTIFSKKNWIFFCPWKHKKRPQKLLIIGHKLFFHKYSPVAKTSPELIFHIINMSQNSSVSLSVIMALQKEGPLKCVCTLECVQCVCVRNPETWVHCVYIWG
jgi:hypothetical protein